VTLVAVTKFASLPMVQDAIAAGITDVGENKIQQALTKFSHLRSSGQNVTRHMIGHLQTNKVKQALPLFDLIQSVDSLKLAQEIQKQAEKLGQNVDVLVQVNTSGEEQKFGIAPAEAASLVEQVLGLGRISVKGFMVIAPLTDDEKIVRRCFSDLRQLSENIKSEFKVSERFDMRYLSMGMTDDYRIAIEEGSNMVRIGRAIFSNE
jgi:hypothetical protein